MAATQSRMARQLSLWADSQPDKIAVVDGPRRISYAQLADDVSVLAGNLLQKGVKPGDRVVAILPNSYEFIALAYACIQTRTIITPFNVLLQQREIEEKIRIADPSLLVYEEGYRYAGLLDGKLATMTSAQMFAPQDKDADGIRPVAGQPQDDDPYVIIFTSGTTGIPKGALLSQGAILHAVESCALTTACDDKDIVLGALPFCHMFGFMYCVLMPIVYGARVVCLNPFRAATALDLVEQEKVTLLGGVPTIYIRLAQEQERQPRNLSSLRYGQIGGAHYANLEKLGATLQCDIMPSYGLTEAPMLAAALPGDPIELRERSVGHIAPDVQIRIVDDNNVPVETGESGEVVCKTPELMLEYFNAPQDITRHLDEEGWFHTDDLGFVDENDCLFIYGRRSDVINRGGYKFSPSEVECVYVNNPDVAEVCLIGEPHPDLGMQTALFVVLNPNAEETSQELREYARDKVAKYKIPDHVYLLDEMPRLSTKKIDKGALRKKLDEINGLDDQPAYTTKDRLAPNRDSLDRRNAPIGCQVVQKKNQVIIR